MSHTEETRASGVGRGYANYALVLLTVVNLVNYLERNAIFALFEPVKRDLGFSDGRLGWLGSAYVLVFSLASVPAGHHHPAASCSGAPRPRSPAWWTDSAPCSSRGR